jgi:hypothetical protein
MNIHYATMRRQCPQLDLGRAALLADLCDRGLLESSLVWCCGEFGRGPKIDWQPPWNGGRNHYGKVFSAVVAGGGDDLLDQLAPRVKNLRVPSDLQRPELPRPREGEADVFRRLPFGSTCAVIVFLPSLGQVKQLPRRLKPCLCWQSTVARNTCPTGR